MTIRQSRYILAETDQERRVRVTEVQRAEEDPFIRKSEIQQTVNNSTLPVSSRAVNLVIEDKIAGIKIPSVEGLATEEYVDNKVSSIDLSEYALTSDLSSAIELINSDLDIKADKTELEGLATEDYVNEKIDEKEVGITEPELISKSVGEGKWMREGAYGIGSIGLRIYNLSQIGFRGGIYNIQNAEELPTGSHHTLLVGGYSSNRMNGIFMRAASLEAHVYDSSSGNMSMLYNDANTTTDKNNVLHSGTDTPINTLNVSDMADTVVDNDLLTVTSGAVFRAIKQLADQIISLEARVRELEDGGI